MRFCKLNTLFFLLFCVANPTLSQTVLRYSDHQSSNEMRTKFLKDVFFPAIEKESNGRIKIEAYWNGELSTSYNAMETVGKGATTDMSTAVPEYTAEQLPLHQIFKSFITGPTGKKQVSFFRRAYAEVPELTQEFENNNVVPIFLGTGYGVGFFSKEEFGSLSDLKETKWRTASFWHRDFLTNCGIEPVSIPWGNQVYEALQNNKIDGLMVNIDSGYNLKVYEQAPYLLTSKKLWLGHLYPVVINKNTWESLDEKDQKAIKRAAEKAYESLGKIMDKSYRMQLKKLRKSDTKIKTLLNKELESFSTCANFGEVQKKWAEEQEAKGIKNVHQVITQITYILNETLE